MLCMKLRRRTQHPTHIVLRPTHIEPADVMLAIATLADQQYRVSPRGEQQQQDSSKLVDAVGRGDVSALEHSLGSTDVNSRVRADFSLVHMAASAGHAAVLALLLRRGGDPDAPDGRRGMSPLLLAAHRGHSAAVEALLDAGANASGQPSDPNGNSPLHVATELGHPKVARALLGGGAACAAPNQAGVTPTHGVGSVEMLRVLVHECGAAALDARTPRGDTPLHTAALRGAVAAARALLDLGAAVDGANFYGASPLRVALWHQQREVARLLRAHGASEPPAAAADERACGGSRHVLLRDGGVAATFDRMLASWPTAQLRHRAPPVAVLDGFLSDAEADAFVAACSGEFLPSAVGNGPAAAGAAAGGTGATGGAASKRRSAECRYDPKPACAGHPRCQRADPLLTAVLGRVAELTGAPSTHLETAVVLRYGAGDRYLEHTDWPLDASRMVRDLSRPNPCGPRVLTVLLYLSTPARGGATHFPRLGLSVEPVKGRALVFPVVRDDDVLRTEPLTAHEAQPVVEGVKYSTNIWVHMYDTATPASRGCERCENW